MSEGAYEENLRHIAEPAASSEREKAVSTTVEDHIALWFTDVLREWAHYESEDEEARGIAVGLASFIDKKVRDQGESYVTLYAHTEKAVDTIEEAAMYGARQDPDELGYRVGVAAGDLRLSFVGDGDPEVVEMDGERTVVYDEEEARESLAEEQMAKAESEHLAELERDANARGVNNRKTPRVNPNYRE